MKNDSKIQINLVDDMREILKQDIIAFGYDESEIENEDIFLVYNELLMRLVQPAKRKIIKSNEFYCPPELQDGLNLLVEKIQSGQSINQHLSRKILSANKADMMLFDWGIHHFHLGTEIDSGKGLIKGTKYVVFAIVQKESVYLIQIYDHDHWADKDVLEIVEKNWPSLLEKFKTEGTPRCSLNNNNIKQLRTIKRLKTCGINPVVTLSSGNAYTSIGGGYLLNQHSLKAAEGASQLKVSIMDYENSLREMMTIKNLNPIFHMRRQDAHTLLIQDEESKHNFENSWDSLVSIYGKLKS